MAAMCVQVQFQAGEAIQRLSWCQLCGIQTDRTGGPQTGADQGGQQGQQDQPAGVLLQKLLDKDTPPGCILSSQTF